MGFSETGRKIRPKRRRYLGKMKIIPNKDGVNYNLELSDEEYEKLQPFLNRYGLLDRFPENMPKPVEVWDWMFPESIKGE